jgi:hypothetical protein
MIRSSVITISLTALCLGLGWSVYEEIKRPDPSSLIAARSAAIPKIQTNGKAGTGRTTIVLPPIEAFGETVSRPLFNISRRPIVVEEPTTVAKPTELKVMLSGIVIGHTQQIAHLRSEADKQTRALSVGDKIDDWRIESILPDRVVLRSGARVETLFMQKPGAESVGRTQRGAAGAKNNSRRVIKPSQRRSRRNYRRDRRGAER